MDLDATRDRYRLAIADRAVHRREQLCDVVVSSILAELPEYANGRSAGDLEDIRAGVQASIDLCLATLRRGVGLREEEQVVLRCTGGQRARQGISKPAMLASVKVAVRVGRTFLMTCSDVGDDPVALMAAFRHISEGLDRFEDDACSALAEGHDEAWGQVLSAADRGEAVLVDRLLEHRFEDEEEVLAHAAEVGLSRHREARVLVVASLGEPNEARLRASVADIRSSVLSAVGPVRYTQRFHLPFVVQPRDPADWAALIAHLPVVAARHGTTIVWSESSERLTGLAEAYRSLREDLPFVPAATTRPGALSALIIRFHRVMGTGTTAERSALLTNVLGPLLALPERERDELVEALDALYEKGGSLAALARHLHLHKNTVGNRMRRVHDVVGLDVRRPAERLVLETALRMRHVVDAAAPSAVPPWEESGVAWPAWRTG